MELTYPSIIYIGVLILFISFLATMISVKKYRGGRKLAGVDMIKDIPHYRSLMLRYGILKFFMVFSLIVSIVLALFIAAKPTIVRTVTTEKHNRDLFICFDISTSLDGVNIELCEQLKDFIKELKGERFGISIFNAKSALIVPLTTDYDYIFDMINVLEESIKEGEGIEYESEVENHEKYYYRFAGTLSEHGSSMIGDGLSNCLYDFPDLDTDADRSRLIVFVTDNDVQGDEKVSVKNACILCAKNNVKVFALAPDFVTDEKNFKSAIYTTGGDYYNTRDKDAMKNLLEDVKKTDVSTEYTSVTTAVDVPEKAMIALIISIGIYFICLWRIKE